MAWDSGWTRGTLELWLRLTSVANVSVLVWPVRMGPDRSSSSVVDWRVWWSWDVTNYVCIWELHLVLWCAIRSNDFPHVLYRLWPIGMTASHLEVIIRRCKTQVPWLWPCDMESNEELSVSACMSVLVVASMDGSR